MSQNWCQKADFPKSVRRNTVGFSLDGKGYVCLGGNNTSSTSGHFKDLEMYDPATDSWTSKAKFPGIARRNGMAFTIDSFAYVGMGWNNSSNFSDIYRYNPNTNTWSTITPYPGIGNRTPIAASVNGKGYIGGGSRSTLPTRYRDFYEYDPVNDSWSQLNNFPFGNRGGGISFSSDSLVYFGLGYDGSSFHDDLWSYNPRTAVWTQLSSFPGSRRFEASCFKLDSNIVIVGGGNTTGSPFSDYYEYDIANDTWTPIIGFSAGARSRGAYFAIGNNGYISTGNNGSSDLKDTWVFSPESYISSINDSIICLGDSIVIDVTTANAIYLWQDSSTNASFTIKDSGLYWVEITIGNCSIRDSIEVSVRPEIPINLGNDTNICPNNSILLDATVSGASYSWQDNSTGATFLAQNSGIYWVDVTLNNCTKRDSVTISLNSEIPIDLGNDTIICPNSSIILNATIPGATYSWQDNSTGATFLAQDSGIYWVDVAVDNCTKRDSISIEFKPELTVNLGADTTICVGDSVVLSSISSTATYLWQDGSTSSNFIAKSEGIYWLEVTLNGCSKRDSIEVFTLTNSFTGLGNDTTLCFGSTLTLDESLPNVFYLWDDNSTASSKTITKAGTYWLEVSLPKCKKRDSITVTYEAEIIANLGNDTTVCFGDTLSLDVSQPNASYLWSDSSTNASLNIVSSGLYWVDVLLNNCSKRDSINVLYEPQRKLNLGNDSTLCADETLLLDATLANSTYLWQDGSTSPSYLVNDSGLYWVNVSNECVNLRDSIFISELDCDCPVSTPNVITPNNDGVNDFFIVSSPCTFKTFKIRIFNRWGVELISYNNISLKWDARNKGIFVEEGVYFYTIEYINEFDSSTIKKAGFFSVLR